MRCLRCVLQLLPFYRVTLNFGYAGQTKGIRWVGKSVWSLCVRLATGWLNVQLCLGGTAAAVAM